MANLRTIKEEKKKESKKKGGQGNKKRKAHLTGNKKKKSTKKTIDKKEIAYKPKTEKEKADAYAELVRKLKSGELTPSYRWHGGGTTDFGDKH